MLGAARLLTATATTATTLRPPGPSSAPLTPQHPGPGPGPGSGPGGPAGEAVHHQQQQQALSSMNDPLPVVALVRPWPVAGQEEGAELHPAKEDAAGEPGAAQSPCRTTSLCTHYDDLRARLHGGSFLAPPPPAGLAAAAAAAGVGSGQGSQGPPRSSPRPGLPMALSPRPRPPGAPPAHHHPPLAAPALPAAGCIDPHMLQAILAMVPADALVAAQSQYGHTVTGGTAGCNLAVEQEAVGQQVPAAAAGAAPGAFKLRQRTPTGFDPPNSLGPEAPGTQQAQAQDTQQQEENGAAGVAPKAHGRRASGAARRRVRAARASARGSLLLQGLPAPGASTPQDFLAAAAQAGARRGRPSAVPGWLRVSDVCAYRQSRLYLLQLPCLLSGHRVQRSI